MPEFVDYEEHGGVAVIRLNRPERMNALGRDLVRDLDQAWRTFTAGPARVAIYTGTGRAFCAGMDLKEAGSGPPSDDDRPLTVFHAGEVTKPVIAAVNGFAIGGGFLDVMRCTLRIAAQDAQFRMAEVTRGILPRALFHGLMAGLPDCLVHEVALGLPISAERALAIGLVNAVVPASALAEKAMEWAQQIAALPPLAVAAILEGLRLSRRLGPDDPQLSAWVEATSEALRGSSDFQEAAAAFREKRAPTFRGR